MKKIWLVTACITLLLARCQTTQQAKEIGLLGFEENVSKGKSVGPIEGGDCVFHVFGIWFGGEPTLARAVMNARKGKTSTIGDSLGGESGGKGGVRYFNNVTVAHDGFDAVVFGKKCIQITATGFN